MQNTDITLTLILLGRIEYRNCEYFLIDEERFNKMAPEEKKSLNLTDPCLFGVINQLAPTKEESTLQTTTATPYKEE